MSSIELVEVDNVNLVVSDGSSKDAAHMPINESRMDPDHQFYEIIIDAVNISTQAYVFQQLKHFSWYMLGVEACREYEKDASGKECSLEVKSYVRTMMLGKFIPKI